MKIGLPTSTPNLKHVGDFINTGTMQFEKFQDFLFPQYVDF